MVRSSCWAFRRYFHPALSPSDDPHVSTRQDMIHQRSQHQDILRLHLHQQSIRRLKSCKPILDNLANLYTTSLPKSTFHKLVQGIGMPKYSYAMLIVLIWKLCQTQGEYPEVYLLDLNVLFFPTIRSIFPTGFLLPSYVLTRHPSWADHTLESYTTCIQKMFSFDLMQLHFSP